MPDANDSPDDDTPEFRSPKRCLARSFRLSRDRWKHKATLRRQEIKALRVNLRDVEVSRDLWKDKALHLQAQLQELLAVVPPPDDVAQAPAQTLAGVPLAAHVPQPAPPDDCRTPSASLDPQEAPPPKKARRARR